MKSRWSVFSALIFFVLAAAAWESMTAFVQAAPVSPQNFTNREPLWTFRTRGAIVGSPALSADGLTLYVGSADHRFYAIDTVSHGSKWTNGLRLGGPIYSSPVIDEDGMIYVGCSDGLLYGISDQGGFGRIEFRTFSSGPVVSSPAIGDDGTIYFGSTDNHLYALFPDGQKKWAFPASNNVATPVIADDGTIFVVAGGVLRGVSEGGSQESSFTLRAAIKSIPALADDGTIYFGANDERVYSLNSGAGSGDVRWRFDTTRNINSSPAIGTDGRIYIASDSSRVYCLTTNAVVKWSVVTRAPVRSALSIGVDGTIYAGCDDGRMYAISPEGKILWTVKTTAAVRSSAAIDAFGVIYFGAGRFVYAVQTEAMAEDADEPAWQMFRKDRRHTARATVNIAATNAPVIVQSPASRTALTNTTVSFTVAADGARPLFYQWRFNLNAVNPASNPTATNATLALASVTLANQGFYDVIVTNAFGRATSAPPTQLTVTTNFISVTNAVVITQQPVSLIVAEGTAASFSIMATGAPAPSFQWYFSTNAIPSASNPTAITTDLLLINVPGTNAGFYYAVATNVAGAVTSVVASLTVTNLTTVWLPNNTNASGTPLSNSPPFITQQPTNQSALTNTTVNITVIAFGAMPLFYQWYDGTNAITAATNTTGTSATLTFTNVTTPHSGLYHVVVSNSLGVVTSSNALLIVTNRPFGSVVGPVSGQKSVTMESGAIRISSIAVVGKAVAIEVAGGGERTKFVLEYTEALSQPEWRAVSTNESGQFTLVDPTPPLHRSRYYRVRSE